MRFCTGAFPLLSIAILSVAGCSHHNGAFTDAQRQAKPNGDVRLSIKHGLDSGAASIDTAAHDSSWEDIAGSRPPKGALNDPSNANKRIGRFENTVWRAKGELESVVLRKDGDYYMVVRSPKGTEGIVEVPDPDQCKGSPLHDSIAATRKTLEERYHPTKDVKNVDEPATFEGVGFYAGRGGNGSGARLMPGTGIKFGK